MSDLADRADNLIHAEIAAGIKRLKSAPVLAHTGRCRFCEEEVGKSSRFCNTDCRDDFERKEARLRRSGTIFR